MNNSEGITTRIGQYTETASDLEDEIEALEQALESCATQVAWLEREQASLDSRRRVLDSRIKSIVAHTKRLKGLREEEAA